MRGWIAATALVALTGCASGDLAGYSLGVDGGGRGLPITRAFASQEEVTPPGRGLTGLAVRTYVQGPDGASVEVAGAACRVSGGGFEATLTTPGRFVLPDLGPDAPALKAECRSGTLAGVAAVAPSYAWADDGGNAAERVVWGLGWTYGYAEVGPMRYPNLRVGLVETGAPTF